MAKRYSATTWVSGQNDGNGQAKMLKLGTRRGRLRLAGLALVGLLFLPYGCQILRPLPPGLDFAGAMRPAGEISFLRDLTWVDDTGRRHSDQQIFDAMLEIVRGARRFIVLDAFLYNDYVGAGGPPERYLAAELTAALIAQRRAWPELTVIVITDPVNTVYGGAPSAQFAELEAAGIEVVTTRLESLRDSNPVYSLFWNVFARPFGNSEGNLMPNPFSDGRVSLRSWLRLINFKANHRKTLIADRGDGLVGLVTSANPHDGSSANTNFGLRFDGPAVLDLLATENAVLAFSGREPLEVGGELVPLVAAAFGAVSPSDAADPAAGATVQILTEESIKRAVIDAIEAAGTGDALRLAMFYLSDRGVITALEAAASRGVKLSVLLDPNKDAFGRTKNGIPARQVAHELTRSGVPLRWCDTHGEQCHIKLLLVDYGDGSSVLIGGSANLTRRNLENFNLETNVAVRGPRESRSIAEARDFLDLMWNNEPGRLVSVDYERYADDSIIKRLRYRFMEASSVSTF
jgi:phosphatidylserine/phosphatidylglycerophosphate/cardiolipin synthase-like enzyme